MPTDPTLVASPRYIRAVVQDGRVVGYEWCKKDGTPCGVPPYTPTEEQPTRVGGTEA